METYFTFADGALRYDCPSCRQRCCRGKGIGLGAAELVPLLGRVPSLAAHLRLGAGGTLAATNLADGCWFLAGDGMCRVETEHGRAAKPLTCRLFPFNRVFRVGDVRVVDVNSMLCPVEAATGEGGGGVTHAELAREIDELSPSPLLDTPAHVPPDLDGDWLALERRASAAAAERARDATALAQAMGDGLSSDVTAAWARVHGVEGGAAPSPSWAPAPPASQRASLSVDHARIEAEVAPRVALLSPSLRWNALFRKGAPSYRSTVARLPRRLRALTFLGALAARTGGTVPSLRGLTELWQSQSGTLDVMTRWSDPVKLAAPSFGADLPERWSRALGTLLAGAFRGGKTLGELVESAAATLPTVERPLAIALAASQLAALFPGG